MNGTFDVLDPARPTVRFPWRDALRVAWLATPLLVPACVSPERLPAGVAYVVAQGRWLIVAGVLAALASIALAGRVRCRVNLGWSPRTWRAFALAAGVPLLLHALPDGLWGALEWSGDEPKYLRMADSLYHDLDLDLAAGHTGTLTAREFVRNVRALRDASRVALRTLVDDTRKLPRRRGWRAGHWAIKGLSGGHYPVHGAGLPLALLPSRWLQPWVDPTRPNSLAVLTLVGLWAVALWQTGRLAQEVSGSAAFGALAGLALACTAPLLLGGYHFYPEAVATVVVPWLARGVRPAESTPSRRRTAALAGVCGALPWLHVKFSLLAVTALVLLLARVRRTRGRLALALVAAALPVAALLLFAHHVTGLLRPDAFYLRYAPDFYAGGATLGLERLALGLTTALFGGRDGVFILAPVVGVAAMGLPWLLRRAPGTALTLGALFASLWLAAALHGGGAPGTPARLLAPVATLLAAPLAVAAVELRRDGRFVWALAATLVISAAISVTLSGSWRRAIDPYEGMFATPAVDFSLDLPPRPRPVPPSPGREMARGALLLAGLGTWTAFFAARRKLPASAWHAARDFHLAAWITLVLLATLAGWLRT